MSPAEIISSLSGFALPLTLVLGLWLAFRWIRRLAVSYPLPDAESKSLNRILLLLAWLALVVLLSAPILEAMHIVQSIATLVFNPYRFASPYESAIAFGLAPMQFNILADLLQTVVVYAYVVWIGARLYKQGRLSFLDRVAAGRFERLLLLLVFAGLVNGALDRVASGLNISLANVVGWQVSTVLVGWAVLALLILLLVTLLDMRLVQTEPLGDEA